LKHRPCLAQSYVLIAQLAPALLATTRRRRLRHGLVASNYQSQCHLTDHHLTRHCFLASFNRFCARSANLFLVLVGSAKAAPAAVLAIAEAAASTEDEPMGFLLQFAISSLHGHQRSFILQPPLFHLPHLSLSSPTDVHCSIVILERFSWHLSSEPERIDGGGGDVTFAHVHSYLNANSSPVHPGHLLPFVFMIFCHFVG